MADRTRLSQIRAEVGSLGGKAKFRNMGEAELMHYQTRLGNILMLRNGIGYYSSLGKLSAKRKRGS